MRDGATGFGKPYDKAKKNMIELWKLQMQHPIWTDYGSRVCFISGCQRKNGLHQYKKKYKKDILD